MLHLPAAALWERYLSSRSPPDHLLYQMLKMVPVWGGGSDFRVEGSTWGRAGRRLRRIIFLVFLLSGVSVDSVVVRAVVVLLTAVRSVLGGWVAGGLMGSGLSSVEGMLGGIGDSTSAIICCGGKNAKSDV